MKIFEATNKVLREIQVNLHAVPPQPSIFGRGPGDISNSNLIEDFREKVKDEEKTVIDPRTKDDRKIEVHSLLSPQHAIFERGVGDNRAPSKSDSCKEVGGDSMAEPEKDKPSIFERRVGNTDMFHKKNEKNPLA